MRRLTYFSDCGMTVQFNAFPYFITFVDLNSVGASFDEVQPAGFDGVVNQGESYNVKAIPLEGTIVGNSLQDLEKYRRAVAMAMNVHYEGTLVAELNNGEKWKIRCRPSGNPDFPKEFGRGQPFTCEWKCDRPYWKRYENNVVSIGQILPMWTFPFATPVIFGKAVSTVTINNETSIEIPLQIEILSQSTLIQISNNTTGQSFQIRSPVEENQKMVIYGDTADVVIVNLETGEQENATNRLVAGSEFISLMPGLNEIELSNGIADSVPLSYIIYNDHSLAI